MEHEQSNRHVLLNRSEEPPMGQESKNCERTHKLTSANQSETQEGSATHEFGVIKISEQSPILAFHLRRLLHK